MRLKTNCRNLNIVGIRCKVININNARNASEFKFYDY